MVIATFKLLILMSNGMRWSGFSDGSALKDLPAMQKRQEESWV